jgi:hypothetical protein
MPQVHTGGEHVQRPTDAGPERELERSGDELEERIDHLDDQIDEARQEAHARADEQDPFEEVSGDWEDTDDAAGGEDPASFDDPEVLDDDEEED